MTMFPKDAACRGMDVDVFFPVPGDVLGVMRAQAVCFDCPVRAECLAFALDMNDTVPGAVYGGTTGEERDVLLRRMAA
jgi:WhiB family transcriptional regulator, redox-sensing transcriptional regulator